MKGTQHVEVSNRNAKFRFDLHRNITIVRGDSGTGKTTLYNMIADYTRLQAESGVNLSIAILNIVRSIKSFSRKNIRILLRRL